MCDYESLTADEKLARAEELIANDELAEAQNVLDSVKEKSGRKYFLQGKLFMAKSWYAEAYKQFRRAVKAEPDNTEYGAALDDLENFRKSAEYHNEQIKQMGQGGSELCCIACGETCVMGICDSICDGCS